MCGGYLPQRFNNGGGGTQLIRWGCTHAPSLKECKINDFEYVYLFVRRGIEWVHTCIYAALVHTVLSGGSPVLSE